MRYTLKASSPLVSIYPSVVRVRANDSVKVKVRASLSRSQVAALPSADQYDTDNFGGLDTLSGVITATPTTSVTGAYALRVPYLLVPRGLSDVSAEFKASSSAADLVSGTLRFKNQGVHSGYADTYALGITDPRGDGTNGTDVRAVGVQTLPGEVVGADPSDRYIQFAVNMYDRFATAAPNEVDIAVDTDGDGEPNYFVVGIDEGSLVAGAYDGVYLSFIFDAETDKTVDAW